MREHVYVGSNVNAKSEDMEKGFDIIGRYLRGEASPEERIRVMKMVENDASFRDEFLAMRKIYDTILMNGDIEISRHRDAGKRRHRSGIFLRAAAAMVAAASLAVGVMYFIMDKGRNEENLVVHSLEAPVGHRTKAVLSDGTEVCLNSGSRLEILLSDSKERRVRLEGEAYLDVTHDEDRPFILETSEMEVKVLGTSFDVSTYGEIHSVVLVEGSVEAGCIGSSVRSRISPDQMYVIDSDTGNSHIEDVDAGSLVTWKDGYLNLQNMTVGELFSRLERYYGVRIIFSDDSKDTFTMSGKLILESRIDSVLDNLATLLDIRYSGSEDGSIVVSMVSE